MNDTAQSTCRSGRPVVATVKNPENILPVPYLRMVWLCRRTKPLYQIRGALSTEIQNKKKGDALKYLNSFLAPKKGKGAGFFFTEKRVQPLTMDRCFPFIL
jgi:hypothetical protein